MERAPQCVQLETRVETLVETRDAQDEEVARLAGRVAVLESELAQPPQPHTAAAQPPAMPGPGAAFIEPTLLLHSNSCESVPNWLYIVVSLLHLHCSDQTGCQL